MSGNKMLIDASHPEETRVAVVRGNRIEDYDFESQEKRQLRGNIYLAKVTRVEPSLQAAFIDYGGNRHGFLAFSEIHPDYYQIPVADRQALLEEEAAQARANREADEADLELQTDDLVDEPENGDPEAVEEEKPKKKRKSRRKTKSAKKAEEDLKADETSEEEGESSEDESPAVKSDGEIVSKDEADNVESSNEDPEEDEDGTKTIAAVIETDEISEPLPEEDDDKGDSDDASEASAEEAEAPAKKPRRTTRRKSKSKSEEIEASTEDEKTAEGATETVAVTEDSSSAEEDEQGQPDEEAEKPKTRRTRRRKSTKAKESAEKSDEETSDSEESAERADDDNGVEDDDVESVGQEDAMEEVPERRRNRRQYKIQEVVKRRQVMLVQVVKEERGNKGAALTTYLSLAGRYSVLMPNTARGGGISRKISNANDRKRLKTIAAELDVPDGMGVILRTAGASRTKVEIKRDFEYLMRVWDRVRALTLSSAAPCLVHEEGNLVKRSIRDLYDKDTSEVLVSGEAGFAEAKEFMGMLIPSHTKKIKLYDQPQSLFSKFGVESHLERMLSPEVTLKSGGYLVMNQTEALVAIDVNSGRATREHSIEETALKTNLEAAEEIARQLRLRDLAGLIVIDFIDMEERRNNRAVEKKLKECLKNDRARIQLGRISHFGLMEMSRQRIRSSVLESTMDVCPHCGGQGYVRSGSAIALHVFRGIEDHVSRHNRYNVVVRTTPDIAIQLLNIKRQALIELEERYGLQISVEGDYAIKGQDFVIEKGQPASRGSKAAEASDDATDAGEESGRKRRRRRKGKDVKSQSEESADHDFSEEDAVSAGSESIAGEEEAEKPTKKRRRGTRGGRKSKAKQEEADATSVKNAGDEESQSESEDAQEKPKRRTTRRKSGKKNDEETAVASAGEDSQSSEPASDGANDNVESEQDTSTRGRTTRRPRKKKAVDEAEATADESSKETLWGGGTGDFF